MTNNRHTRKKMTDDINFRLWTYSGWKDSHGFAGTKVCKSQQQSVSPNHIVSFSPLAEIPGSTEILEIFSGLKEFGGEKLKNEMWKTINHQIP